LNLPERISEKYVTK